MTRIRRMRGTARGPTRGKMIVSVALGLALVVLVSLHAPGLNGNWYWRWDWDHVAPQWFIPPMFVAYLLHAYGQYLYHRYARAVVPLILFMAAAFALQIIGRGMKEVPFSLRSMTTLVRDPV